MNIHNHAPAVRRDSVQARGGERLSARELPSGLRLSQGDTLTATVVRQKGETLTLRTPEGVSFTAQNSGKPLAPGQTLELVVTRGDGQAVTIEVLSGTSGQPRALLNAWGAQIDSGTLEIAGEMLRQRAELTPDSFDKIQGLMARYKNLSAEQSVFLQTRKLPVAPLDVQQFQAFVEHKNELGQQLAQLTRLFGTVEDSPVSLPVNIPAAAQSAPPTAALSLAAVMPDAVPAQSTQAEFTPPLSSSESPAAPQSLPASDTSSVTAQPQPAALAPNGTVSIVPPNNTASPSASAPVPEHPTPLPDAPVIPSAAQESATAAAQPEPNAPPMTALPRESVRPSAAAMPGAPPESAQPATGGQAAPLAATAEPPAQSYAVQPTQSPAAPSEPSTSLPELVSRVFRRIDSEARRELPLKLQSACIKRDLSELLHALESRIDEVPDSARGAVTRLSHQIEQQMRWLDQVNQLTSFVQIPIHINGERETAELYVFNDARDGRKRIDPENATMFLCLNTAHIGRVESFVKLIGKNVECDFTWEAQTAAAACAGAMQELNDSLRAQGYTLARTSSSAAAERRDIIDVVTESESIRERYSFNRLV